MTNNKPPGAAQPAPARGAPPSTSPSPGLALLAAGNFSGATEAFLADLAAAPERSEAHFHLGLTAYAAGRLDQAEAHWLATLARQNPDLAWHLAALALRREDWCRGWLLAEARFFKRDRPVPRRHPDLPAWEGEALAENSLLLWGDQGLGDQIQFARFVPQVQARCPRLRLEVDAPLVRLFAALFPGLPVGETGKTPPDPGSRQQCLASLPRILAARSATELGAAPPFAPLPAAARAPWQKRLGAPRRPRVGLAWAGNPQHPNDRTRSVGLAALAPLFALAERCDFHALQVGGRAAEGAGSGLPYVDWSGQIADFYDSAGLVAELDLVVTVDSAVAHLAGALGKPVWILIPAVPDWRWGDARGETTLWYPTARLFRQAAPGDWGPVVARLVRALEAQFPALPPGPGRNGKKDEPPPSLAADAADATADEATCLRRLAADPLHRPSLVRLAQLAPKSPDPRHLLPVFHRGRSHPEAALMLARLLVRLDKKKAALALLRPLTGHQPKLAYAWLLRSDLARQLHRAEEAIDSARQALSLDDTSGDAWLHLANALREGKDLPEALAAIQRAAELSPRSPGVLNNLGVLQKEDGRLEEAVATYRRALAVEPRNAAATTNLGSALRDLGRFDESLACFRRALEADPGNPDTWFGLGNTLKESGRVPEAITAFREALARKPDHVDVQVNLSLLLLLTGQFGDGWDLYEQRFHRPKNPVRPRRFAQPLWKGESLAGQRLLVWGEQGAGDKIMGARLLPEVAAESTALVVETDTRLLRLLAANFPAYTWVTEATPADPATATATRQAPLLSLARFRRRNLAAFGDGRPYLKADASLAAAWKERLAGLAGRRVGLVWAGSPTHQNDARRSLALERFAPLFERPGISFVSLQVGPEAAQAAASRLPLADFTADLGDYADTAALIANLDLVIAVDTSVAHLSAALGVPTWILVPFHPDWRWLDSAPDSTPWYASARLFRQPAYGDWTSVLHRVAEALGLHWK